MQTSSTLPIPAPTFDNWPAPVTRETKPWTRWWWLGSAVSEKEITRHLELFARAGMGGVEISPIYGVPGYEEWYVPYLSAHWIELLAHTLHEAERLDMGVDMILGTGWPFGGPTVSDADAPRKLVWAESGAPIPDDADFLAQDRNGLRLYLGRTKQQVKRAAPGGEGNVVDHYDAEAVRRYLQWFDDPLAALPEGCPNLRSVFNDSFEVFGANATPELFAEFRMRRGYNLSDFLPALHGSDTNAETVTRVRSDYRQTIGDLVREAFLGPLNDWAHGKKFLTRNQAHGSPGNLLDLYGMCDIPETEVFGPTLGGITPLHPNTPDYQSEEEALLCKMASSAAHVMGRPLCSSESFTWLGEHGCVPLSHLKAEADALFALGINHIFFHGTPFSPEDMPWPGWLFYATTHVAPTNPWWDDLPTLNAYIARCQSFLQAGVPDNDVLFYFPFYDLLASETGAHENLQWMTVHKTDTYLRGSLPEWCNTAHALTNGGWACDFVSDRQLNENIEATNEGGLRATRGGSEYRTLLIAGCKLMPPGTMERIAALAQAGATVCVLGELPSDVPGLSNLTKRRARFEAAKAALLATGRVHQASDIKSLMQIAGVKGEESIAGLQPIRRTMKDGSHTYFISNADNWFVRRGAWATFARAGEVVTLYDPMTGARTIPPTRDYEGERQFFIGLPPGASAFVTTKDVETTSPYVPRWPYRADAGEYAVFDKPWQVEFIKGGPVLPPHREVASDKVWRGWVMDGPKAIDAKALRDFSGTARYSTFFSLPAVAETVNANDWALHIREVKHSARIYLNGQFVQTLVSLPWRVLLPNHLLRRGSENLLQIEVTNLMANRLSDLEKREGNSWRPFFMVDIRYKPFENAASWEPLPSGLTMPPAILHLREPDESDF